MLLVFSNTTLSAVHDDLTECCFVLLRTFDEDSSRDWNSMVGLIFIVSVRSQLMRETLAEKYKSKYIVNPHPHLKIF